MVASSKQLASPTTFGSVRAYICLTGYEVKEQPAGQRFGKTTTSTNTSSWEKPPVCKPVECGSLPTAANATIMATATTFGSKASVACDAGFLGSSQISCTASGTWTSAAKCVKSAQQCGSFQELVNGVCACNPGYYDTTDGRVVCF